MLDLFDCPVPLDSCTLDCFGSRKTFSVSKFWMDLTIQFVWAKSTLFVDASTYMYSVLSGAHMILKKAFNRLKCHQKVCSLPIQLYS